MGWQSELWELIPWRDPRPSVEYHLTVSPSERNATCWGFQMHCQLSIAALKSHLNTYLKNESSNDLAFRGSGPWERCCWVVQA